MQIKRHVQETNFTLQINAITSSTKTKLQNQRRLADRKWKEDRSGILHSHGRVIGQNLPETTLFPKIPPNNHRYLSLAINSLRQKLMHGGLSYTLSYSYQKKILEHTSKNNSQTNSSELSKMQTASRELMQNAPDGSIPTLKNTKVLTL